MQIHNIIISLCKIAALLSYLILLYIYLGYPILLFILQYLVPKKRASKTEIQPKVSLLISCYNEEAVIREKLENSLALDYSKDKLEIIAVSDFSTDRTDEIVNSFKNQGVRLIRQQERKGKTLGLNLAVPQAKGEIIVFSDANAIYQPDAIQKLVRNFTDSKIGFVVGESRYKDKNQTLATKSENTYWQYEIFLKKMENRLHHVVGGDGAIYAIRQKLYEKLLPTDINDFVNPLQIVLKGYHGVYEPEAISWEEAAGSFEKEFQRKVRIVNRSFSGLLRLKSILNPFKTGIFCLEILSHKLLRWFTSIFMIIFIGSCFILSHYDATVFQWITLFIILFLWCAYLGHLFNKNKQVWPVFYYPYYFLYINSASLIGVYKSLKGEIQTTWETPRTKNKKEVENAYSDNSYLIHIFASVLFYFTLKITGDLAGIHLLSDKVIYWGTFIIIGYIYFGYPAVLKFLSKYYAKPIRRKEITPEVTLLICAYNEEEVIEEKIKNSFELDYPSEKLKIVVASDGSSDNTNNIARQYTNDRLILMDYPRRQGKIKVINDTMPKLKSEIIVFSDANAMYHKDAIKNLVRNFADPSIGGVSGNVIIKNEETIFGKPESLYYVYERWIQEKESDFGSIIGADGAMYAIRKDLFHPPPPNIILDDFIISMNISLQGYRLVYDKEAVAQEKSTISSKTEFLRKSRVIAGAIQALKQKEGVSSPQKKGLFFCFLSHKLLRWMIPIFYVVFLIVNCRLYFLSKNPIYTYSMIIHFFFYGLILISLTLMKKAKNWKIISIPFYLFLENGAALYGIYKGIYNKQAVTWQKFGRLSTQEINKNIKMSLD